MRVICTKKKDVIPVPRHWDDTEGATGMTSS
ncbi:hypothetical protein HCR18_01095 [Wolbachia pipientis]|nr:hypothetical protein [Wolbachia pipientis]MBA8769826.1 hypothetical protein [Wolbachia pipientis]